MNDERVDSRTGKFEIYTGKDGEYRWRLLASNGRIIADSSEGYLNHADCLHGIILVQNSKSWPITEALFDNVL